MSRCKEFSSLDPATQKVHWTGLQAGEKEVDDAFLAAKKAADFWRKRSLDERISFLHRFETILKTEKESFALIISGETGKPLWESITEVQAMIGKIAISISAYHERCPPRPQLMERGELFTVHKPHGICAVFGPFNFPGHLPNGHIIPALLAGNTIVFKGSEFTPRVSDAYIECWKKAGLPDGVLNLVQGDAETGKLVASHPLLNGLFFTGSAPVGLSLLQQFAKTPDKILALEMGGNNPLVFDDFDDCELAADAICQSAYLTTGQRCSAARRLIVVSNDALIEKVVEKASSLTIGPYTMRPEPFMGPVIHLESMNRLLADQKALISQGGIPLLEMRQMHAGLPFLTPGLIDVTAISHREDKECFGPLLQLIRVKTFEEAIAVAKDTRFGLTAGLFSRSEEKFERFLDEVSAGVINWNTQITQASSQAPFGGVGLSGNHRPSAFYAADYCSYPVATIRRKL